MNLRKLYIEWPIEYKVHIINAVLMLKQLSSSQEKTLKIQAQMGFEPTATVSQRSGFKS